MHRFFVAPDVIGSKQVTLEGELARQLTSVLRLVPGDEVLLLDNTGWEYQVELRRLNGRRAEGQVLEKRPAQREPEARIVLYQALLKASRFEYVLQKGTEVGVSTFVPVVCHRSVPDLPAQSVKGKMARWQRIIQEAAEQSGRGRLPELHEPCAFGEAVSKARGLSLILWEGEREMRLREALRQAATGEPLSLFVGPEGGFTAEEVALSRAYGAVAVTLGRRTLRAETAGLVAASLALFERGELG